MKLPHLVALHRRPALFHPLPGMALACALAAGTACADPVLEISRTGNQIELKWPVNYDWYVQASPSLEPDSWEPLFEKPSVYINSLLVKVPMVGKARFFRLAKNDAPDDNYIDENGDGIDGDVNRAIFVTAIGGHDNNPGTRALPMATLQAAISRASTQNKDVYVGKGTYATPDLLVLSSGVNLYGKYDPANNWKRGAGNTTTISGGATAMVAQNITAPVTVDGFTIQSSHATLAGSSSYGVRVLSSPALVTLRRNLIIAGNGAAGGAGAHGVKGADGGAGGKGGAGYADNENLSGAGGAGGTSPVGRTGGKGGKGGLAPSYWGAVGSPGSTGAGGGAGGAGGEFGLNGFAGEFGAPGVAGEAASGGASFGSVGVGGYVPAQGAEALSGTHGHGGGGGGGGGGQDCTFCDNGGGNGGGGGGGGGQAGTGGKAGKGGGGSFGVLCYNSEVRVQFCTINTGNGGAGARAATAAWAVWEEVGVRAAQRPGANWVWEAPAAPGERRRGRQWRWWWRRRPLRRHRRLRWQLHRHQCGLYARPGRAGRRGWRQWECFKSRCQRCRRRAPLRGSRPRGSNPQRGDSFLRPPFLPGLMRQKGLARAEIHPTRAVRRGDHGLGPLAARARTRQRWNEPGERPVRVVLTWSTVRVGLPSGKSSAGAGQVWNS